ncbi:hypothetical protein EZV62_027091 [Acer yangbiense]|uniref:ABC transporter domain-containing protein n=1 Tax=Acer yangbiense TaxID=1000413 RepID=A0A5C7GTI2_9ROSI|nr:hypothetical protein EZV62_027091 [Acer yangbiense]
MLIDAFIQAKYQAGFSADTKVMFAFSLSALAISQATTMAPDTNKAKVLVASILEILDNKPKIDSSSNEGTMLSSVDGDIEFERTVALVGESGSGKSTVINLLERFYNPDSGRIFLDLVEIHKLKLKLSWLRQQMGLVGQEPILFNKTIRVNIAYDKQGQASEEEIIAATKAANAHNFTFALLQGYDTNDNETNKFVDGQPSQMSRKEFIVLAFRRSNSGKV